MAWIDVSSRYFQEKMLWACVLRRTIFDYVLYKGIGKHKMKWQHAHKYIFGEQDQEDDGLSFVQICALFGWEPDYLRRKVKELDRSKIKKLETNKFKEEFFDEDTTSIFVQSAQWESGNPVPKFAPYNFSKAYRSYMKLKEVQRDTPKVLFSSAPYMGGWRLSFA